MYSLWEEDEWRNVVFIIQIYILHAWNILFIIFVICFMFKEYISFYTWYLKEFYVIKVQISFGYLLTIQFLLFL